MGFQRARSEEQRAQRREAILATAAAMLDETSVSALTLSELSRRVGLAKSNVLRYFESREDVLLELLDRWSGEWVVELAAAAGTVDPGADVMARIGAFAEVVAHTASARPALLALISAQSEVLEHNVSTQAVLRHKHATLAVLDRLVGVLRGAVPEVGDAAGELCLTIAVLAGAFAAQANTSVSCETAFAADPALQVLRIDLAPMLRGATAALIAGALVQDASGGSAASR
ncbi:TetR family transcriptional regulator [Tsukamurella soli]|uniref:TetR family transcriptional regulator n=1 Tax=Tsukamurella soli TaxID=644556 RepID=UPI0031EF4C1D